MATIVYTANGSIMGSRKCFVLRHTIIRNLKSSYAVNKYGKVLDTTDKIKSQPYTNVTRNQLPPLVQVILIPKWLIACKYVENWR